MATDILIPSWLDKDLLTSALQKDEPANQINVLSYTVKPAVAAGNNYCCSLFRVNVEYERNGGPARISLIVKCPLPDGPAKTLIDNLGIIDKECLIYKELLPIMNKLMNKEIAPKDYFCSVPGVIILQDLKEQNYVMCDRLEQLDFDHCNNFMKAISTFHALSLHIHKDNPELIEQAGREIFFQTTNPESKKHFTDGFNIYATILKEWEGFEHFAKFYENNLNALWDETVAVHHGKKHLRVLNHGDAWTNNMLFKHDDSGKVVDMKLIDLQLCKFASPAVDLVSFILTSAQEEVKENRLPELYETYLETFNSTLETVGSEERLTAEQLQDELEFVQILPFCLLPGYAPMVLCEKDNVMNMDTALEIWEGENESGKHRSKVTLNGKHYKKVAKYTLKKLEEQGSFSLSCFN